MKAAIYKIEALTNMHVGSGDANYGVIDNLVQRDVVTNLPTINGSSLKGALKEFFEIKKFEKINAVFGSSDNNADYRFLSSNLLAIPVRSNKKAYFLATCPAIINQLEKDANNFDCTLDFIVFKNFDPATGTPIIFTNDRDGLLIEDFYTFDPKSKPENCKVFKDCENVIILSNEDFNELCNDFNLPVIARNKVGENKNLWYEQVVPSKTLFYFTLLHNEKNFDSFEEVLTDDKSIIHIGANATVGYGFTKISKLN
jgi:CRISPR-associated protein Cmr4